MEDEVVAEGVDGGDGTDATVGQGDDEDFRLGI